MSGKKIVDNGCARDISQHTHTHFFQIENRRDHKINLMGDI